MVKVTWLQTIVFEYFLLYNVSTDICAIFVQNFPFNLISTVYSIGFKRIETIQCIFMLYWTLAVWGSKCQKTTEENLENFNNSFISSNFFRKTMDRIDVLSSQNPVSFEQNNKNN